MNFKGDPICIANNQQITCKANEKVVGINSAGVLQCQQMVSQNCGPGQFQSGLNANGQPNCQNLPASTLGKTCSNPNQALKGYDGHGNPICMDVKTPGGRHHGPRASGFVDNNIPCHDKISKDVHGDICVLAGMKSTEGNAHAKCVILPKGNRHWEFRAESQDNGNCRPVECYANCFDI